MSLENYQCPSIGLLNALLCITFSPRQPIFLHQQPGVLIHSISKYYLLDHPLARPSSSNLIANRNEACAPCRTVDRIVECTVPKRADTKRCLAEALELRETQQSIVPLYIEGTVFRTLAYRILACNISGTLGIGAMGQGYIMRVSVGFFIWSW